MIPVYARLGLPTMTKPTKLRTSGPNIPNSRRHTVQLLVRCPPSVAEEARELLETGNVTLADILAAGVAALKEKK